VVSATTIGNLTSVNQTDGSGDGSGSGTGASSGTGIPGGPGEDTDDDDVDVLSPLSMSFLGVFLSIVIFLSVAGNILVCIAIYTERSLRRIGNLFLASLAIADLFVASLVMTFAGVNDLLGYWIFGAQFCDTWVAFDVMCSTASILNLCAISLDRYIHIKDPLRSVIVLMSTRHCTEQLPEQATYINLNIPLSVCEPFHDLTALS
uniref:G-protein coupled receptors family 1 profile domain-containing protein n=1 Tax=Anopheles christyi TaxID=43041 RepID=A0A182JZP2_9DIPT